MATITDPELHYFSVDFAIELGLDKSRQLVWFHSDEHSCASLGLEPVLMYWITAPLYSRKFRLLVDPQKPLALSNFLAQAWSEEGAMGIPRRLEIKSKLTQGDLGFLDWIADQDVEIGPPSNIKSFVAHETSCRKAQDPLAFQDLTVYTPFSFHQANEALRYYDTTIAPRGSWTEPERALAQEWNQRTKKTTSKSPLVEDWLPSAVVQPAKTKNPRAELAVAPGEFPYAYTPGVKGVASMWPGGRRAFLKGLNLRSEEFDQWANGRAHLPHSARLKIVQRLRLEWREDYDEWEMVGGFLLIASEPRPTIKVFDDLSHGGDLRYAFEMQGPSGEVRPMRALIFERYGGLPNIILFEVGSKAEVLLQDQRLINRSEAVHLPEKIWAQVCTIIDNRETFTDPQIIAEAFGRENEKWLDAQAE